MSVTPATVPSVVTNIACVAGPRVNDVTVSFTAPVDNGGLPIQFYRVYSADTADQIFGTSSPIVVTVVPQATPHLYRFVVVATNGVGSAAKSPRARSE